MEYFVYFDYYFFRSASPPCKKNNATYHANVPSTLVLHIQWNIVIALSTLLIYFMECFVYFDYYCFQSAIETDFGPRFLQLDM